MARRKREVLDRIPFGISRWWVNCRMERDGLTLIEAVEYELTRQSAHDRFGTSHPMDSKRRRETLRRLERKSCGD